MAIKYSLGAHLTKPNDKSSEMKVYPFAQYTDLMNLNEFARHIQSHGSPFTRDVIIGVLTAAVDCLREQLVAGKKVNFGEMGAFYVSLRSEGAESAEAFDPNVHIKHVYVHWERSEYFADLKGDPDIKWEYTLTHKAMAEAKKLQKQEVNQSLAGSSGSGGSDNGGNNGGQADPGDVTP